MLRWALDRRTVLKLGLTASAWALWERIGAERLARAQTPLLDPRERHLANIRQLTFGGLNAEAYFDPTGTRLVFQSTRPPFDCDQIFTMGVDGGDVRLVSTGRGRTTCAYFFPNRLRLLYASTHFDSAACPPPPDRSRGYAPLGTGISTSTSWILTATASGGLRTGLGTTAGHSSPGTAATLSIARTTPRRGRPRRPIERTWPALRSARR